MVPSEDRATEKPPSVPLRVAVGADELSQALAVATWKREAAPVVPSFPISAVVPSEDRAAETPKKRRLVLGVRVAVGVDVDDHVPEEWKM
jgi:hypothetical protein